MGNTEKQDFSVGFMIYVINKKLAMDKLLNKVFDTDEYVADMACFCPFHENEDTKAAKIYQNQDNTQSLWCFAEQKMYRPADVIMKIMGKRIASVFPGIWQKVPEEEKSQLIAGFGQSMEVLSEEWKETKSKLLLFKRGEITYEKYLEIYAEGMFNFDKTEHLK